MCCSGVLTQSGVWMELFLSCEFSLCSSLSLPLPTADLQEVVEEARRQKSRWEEKRLRGEIAAFFFFCARMFKTSPAFTLGGIQPCAEHQFSFAAGFESSLSEVFVSRLRCGGKSLSFEMAMWGKKKKKKSSPYEMIGYVSSQCPGNSVLSAGFMHRNGAISTRESRFSWIVLRWRTVGCPTKSEKILPFKYLCAAQGFDHIWTSTLPVFHNNRLII